MKNTQDSTPATVVVNTSLQSWDSTSFVSAENQLVYREMDVIPVQVVDPLADLVRNTEQLQDLQARLRFMMREVRSMMKG